MVNRTSLKFIGGFVLIIALAMGGLYFLNYYFSAEQKSIRYYKNLERQYAEDTYGGQTPEETLQLFIDALKAGDIELASKYFVVEEREKTKNDLVEAKDNGGLSGVIERTENLRLSKKEDERAFYSLTNNEGVAYIQVMLAKNSNDVWKIIDM